MISTEEKFISRYPKLYHMASHGAWQASIRQHGLMSTKELLRFYKVPCKRRKALLDKHRPCIERVCRNGYPDAFIRDQKPMNDKGLRIALSESNLSVRDWYRKLNGMVFFWPTKERLFTMSGARAYRETTHDVLVFDTRRLVEDYRCKILLSPINSGATKPIPHARGENTFSTFNNFPWHKRRNRGSRIVAELCIKKRVRNPSRYIHEVLEVRDNQVLNQIFP